MKIVKRCTKKSKANKPVAMVKGHAKKICMLDWKQKKMRSCTDWLGRETEQGKMYST